MRMSQLYMTEICECSRLKQKNRPCKTCGFIAQGQPQESAEGAYELPTAVARPMSKGPSFEEEMEFLRR